MRQIILDTETTGLAPEAGHRIIEIGCLEMVNRRLTQRHLHYYINPERDVERAAAEVHGITSAFLQDKPLFADIVDELIKFLTGAELIIHNASFDIGFLNAELKRCKGYRNITYYCSALDTLPLARKKHPGQQNSLDALCRRYGVDNSNRELHGALKDAELLAQVYLLMTGGQTQLFEVEAEDTTTAATEAQIIAKSQSKVQSSILLANADELNLHEEFLNFMRKKGQCRWEAIKETDS
jgi:DNA polymerase-3 subunit epsilon